MDEYRRLGSTGTKVSPICLGTGRFGQRTGGTLEIDRETAHAMLDRYAEAGGNFLDTADMYGQPGGGPRTGTSEEWIGDWLADRDRERFVIGSKVCMTVGDGPNETGLSRTHVRHQIERSLDRLGTDYLDIYYIHRWDPDTPIDETLATMDWLVEDGRVNYLGVSSMAAWQLTKGLWTSDVNDYERFEVAQPLFNAAQTESGGRDAATNERTAYLDVCADQELAVCPHSPLAGGFLTDKYERGPDGEAIGPEGARADILDRFQDSYVSERGWRVLDAIRSVADETNATPAQVALRWLMDRERFTCVPIVGARSVEQLEENLAARSVSLTSEQRERITDARTTPTD